MLFFSRRFFPFFIVQFFGALNDNLFKNAMLIYFSLFFASQKLSLYTNLAMAFFILSMIIFSAWAGLIAESIEKRRLILILKTMELVIILAGIAAFKLNSTWAMLAVLFFLGMQSAFFGPVKYGILPERLKKNELMLGNGLVEAGTFLAILAGTILGADLVSRGYVINTKGEVISQGGLGALYTVMLVAAGTGLIAAWFVPKKALVGKNNRLPPFKPWQQTIALIRYTYKQKALFFTILAISWFWLLGAVLLTQIPQFSRDILSAGPQITTYLLALFSIGIGIGSIVSAKLTAGRIESGLSALAAFLMLPFLLGLIIISGNQSDTTQMYTFGSFISTARFWSVSLTFFGLATIGGIYVVPLYTQLQYQSEEGHKSQMVAANNIINSLFVVGISLFSVLILSVLKFSMQSLFIFIGIGHLIVSVILFNYHPHYILRSIASLISHTLYRFRVEGRENLPEKGAVLIVCNHVTYMDSFFIFAAIRRPVRFMIYYLIYRVKLLKWLFDYCKTIPIAGRSENMKIFKQAFIDAEQALKNGEQVLIFPEGGLTYDGKIAEFKRGAEYIVKNTPVTVVPMYLDNLWGSFFSRCGGLFKGKPKKFRATVTLRIGKPLPASVTAVEMRDAVIALENK